MTRLKNILFVTTAIACMTIPAASVDAGGDSFLDQEIVDAIVSGGDADEVKPRKDFQRLEDVLRQTYASNPSLLAARAELKAVQENLSQAQAGWKPSLSASGDITNSKIDGSNFGGGEGTTSKQVQADITQPVYRGGRTMSATNSAMNLIMAQRHILKDREQGILLSVATAYVDVYRDHALLKLSENNRDVIAVELEATRERFEVGELTRTDVSQAESRLAGAEAQQVQAMGDLQKSRAVFERVSGVVPTTLGRPRLSFPIPDTLIEAQRMGEENNPSILAANYIHRSAKKDIHTIFGELLPELQLFGSWNRQYDPQPGLLKESTTRSVGLSATIPFYSGGATRSRVRQARHEANRRYMEIIEARRQARQEVIENWEQLQATKAEIRSRRAQVKAARIAKEGVRAEMELGVRTILDSLDADQEYLDAQTALVSAQRDEIVATFALAATLGLLTPEILGFSDLKEDYDQHLDGISWKILGMDVDIGQAAP